MTNATSQRCFTRHAMPEPPLVQNGHLTLQTHDIGWIVAGFFTITATFISLWLISMHLMWYTKKRQQRYVVRLLLMVPIYAIVSLASYIFWDHAIPITLVRDSYESFVLYSFFYLLLQYLSPTTEGQKEVFRSVVLQKWLFPLGSVKYRPKDGLYFLQLMKWGVLQYCVVRPTTTLAAVILDFIGFYCSDSWSPGWGHIYITIIVSLSVTLAMYCLFQLYMPIAVHLAPHKPLLKLFSVKAVVFLTFWQASGLSLLSMFGVIKDTPYMTADDINTGIAAILETFEMTCFAILHFRAFSYKPYRTDGQKLFDPTPRLPSLMHVLDIRDMWREIQDGSVYMGKTIRGVEAEEEARRRTHFAKVMGREREFIEAKVDMKESQPTEEYLYDEDLLLDSRGRERQLSQVPWLDARGDKLRITSDDDDRGKSRKRDSAGEYEALFNLGIEGDGQGHTRENKSWWKGIYNRLSKDGPDRRLEERLSSMPQRPLQKHHRRHQHPSRVPSLDSPPPPPCVMFEYSGLGDSSSRVRLSSYHRLENSTTNPKGPPDCCSGHYPRPRSSSDDMHDETADVQLEEIALPTSTSQTRDIEFVSSSQANLSPVARNDHNRSRSVFSGITQSDGIAARVFSNSTLRTFDGKVSFGRKSDSSPMPYPVSLPRVPQERVSSQRPGRGPQKQSSPMRSHQRPRIVLPAPLSTTGEMATKALPHVPAHLPPINFRLLDSRSVGGHNSVSRETLEFAIPSDAQLRHTARCDPEKSKIARHHDSMQFALLKESQTMERIATPAIDSVTPHNSERHTQTCASPHSPMVENGRIPPAPNVESRLPWLSASSMENRTLPITTTSPRAPMPPRQLRHPRGDIGTARRPWP